MLTGLPTDGSAGAATVGVGSTLPISSAVTSPPGSSIALLNVLSAVLISDADESTDGKGA